MKKTLMFNLAILALSFMLNAQAPFMENPSSEKTDAKNQQAPLGFPVYLTKPGTGCQWSDKAARTGRKGFDINLTGKGLTFAWNKLKLDTDIIYKFSVWYKTQMDYQARIITIRAAGGKASYSNMYPSASEWTEADIYFKTISPDNNYTRFAMVAGENGHLKFENKDGKKVLTNCITIKGQVDDFYLGKATEKDFGRSNLFQNGDFEHDPQSAPGWTMFFTADNRLNIDAKEHFTGKQSARIDFLPKGKRTGVPFSTFMPIKAGAIYMLTFAAKATKYTPVTLHLCFGNAITGTWRKTETVTDKWKEYSYIIEMPKKDTDPRQYTREWNYRKKYQGEAFLARACFRYPGNLTEGSLWLDKCSLKKISGNEELDN